MEVKAQKRKSKLTDVAIVIVPIAAGHVLVDLCVHPRHFAQVRGVSRVRDSLGQLND